MSAHLKSKLSELLQLSEKERLMLAKELISSVPGTHPDDELWEELERRWKEVESGKVKPLPVSIWKKELKKQIAKASCE